MTAFLEVRDLVYTYQIDNFDPIKQNILSAIDKMNLGGAVNSHTDSNPENVGKTITDYYLDLGSSRPYSEFIDPVLNDHSQYISDIMCCRSIRRSGYWFQQYLTGGSHCLHVHPGSMFANVLYVEFPKESSLTSLYYLGKEFEFPVAEGTILTFPSFFAHQSKPNKSSRKTVISYNLCTDQPYLPG